MTGQCGPHVIGIGAADVADERDGGAGPLGGEQGHKGFGLAVMVDILGGILAGAGTAIVSGKTLNNGTFLVCIDPSAFVAKDEYERQLGELMDYLHAAPPAPGKKGVIMPGEYEHMNRLKHTQAGFEVEEEIWQSIVKAAQAIEVKAPIAAQPPRA